MTDTSPHSVTIARTAAGAVTFEVKAYAAEPATALERALETFRDLQKQFPKETR